MAFQPATPTRDWTAGPRTMPGGSPAPAPRGDHAIFPAPDRSSPNPHTSGFQPNPSRLQEPNFAIPASENDVANSPAIETADEGPTRRTTALQVHNTYLISETEEGMIVIDQHALHERIIYEQLREKVLGGKLESQRLLVPEPVTLPPAEAAAVLEQSQVLEKIGMVVEPFGGDTVLVASYPAMLANHNPAEMLRGVIDKLMEESTELDQRDLVDELLHMISCKAAIKAGDKLTPEEISSLLDHRELCQDAHHCPHGRPTSLVFSREELDRRFKRI